MHSTLLCVHKRFQRTSLMRISAQHKPTDAVLKVRCNGTAALQACDTAATPIFALFHFVTQFFISPATHSMSLKSYFLPARLLPKPALHQCIRLIESSVLGDSSVMTHDIQLMLFFRPGGLILLSFFVLRWHVKRYLTSIAFVRITFKLLTIRIILFCVLLLLPVSQASHYCHCLSTSCYVYWTGVKKSLDIVLGNGCICVTQTHILTRISTNTHT